MSPDFDLEIDNELANNKCDSGHYGNTKKYNSNGTSIW
jgi:hypothetical protein